MSYLKMLREWKTGDRGRFVFFECDGDWSVTLKREAGDEDGYHGYDEVKRWGQTRKEACERCYNAAVKHGIIEEVAADAGAE